MRIALLNNPGLHAAMATLGVSDAERVQAGSLPNPHFAIGRFTEGSKVEIERGLGFNVIGLLSLPWRAQWQTLVRWRQWCQRAVIPVPRMPPRWR